MRIRREHKTKIPDRLKMFQPPHQPRDVTPVNNSWECGTESARSKHSCWQPMYDPRQYGECCVEKKEKKKYDDPVQRNLIDRYDKGIEAYKCYAKVTKAPPIAYEIPIHDTFKFPNFQKKRELAIKRMKSARLHIPTVSMLAKEAELDSNINPSDVAYKLLRVIRPDLFNIPNEEENECFYDILTEVTYMVEHIMRDHPQMNQDAIELQVLHEYSKFQGPLNLINPHQAKTAEDVCRELFRKELNECDMYGLKLRK
ncbi:hypothetical protein SNEBB_001711 [Seison nebaliae]|nr:hypothetical protein SNEBB_001711 [Seison nebaliae]